MERFKIEKITKIQKVVSKVTFDNWNSAIDYSKLLLNENLDLIEVKISRINPKCLYRVTVDRS